MLDLKALLTKMLAIEHIAVATNVDAYKLGSIVAVHFLGVNTTSTSTRTTYGILPSGWRPPKLAIFGNISGNTGYGCVDEVGQVQAFRPTIGRIDATVIYIATQ